MKHLSQLPTQVTNEVIELINTFVTKWNAKNAENFGSIFTEDAEFIDIVNQIAIGKREIIDQHLFPFNVVNKIAVLTMESIYIRAISDELVMVTGTWLTEKSTTPQGDVLPDRTGIIQMICKKESRNWKVRLIHNTDFLHVYNKHVDTTLRFYESPNKK